MVPQPHLVPLFAVPVLAYPSSSGRLAHRAPPSPSNQKDTGTLARVLEIAVKSS